MWGNSRREGGRAATEEDEDAVGGGRRFAGGGVVCTALVAEALRLCADVSSAEDILTVICFWAVCEVGFDLWWDARLVCSFIAESSEVKLLVQGSVMCKVR